jgi:hypothetical protein
MFPEDGGNIISEIVVFFYRTASFINPKDPNMNRHRRRNLL